MSKQKAAKPVVQTPTFGKLYALRIALGILSGLIAFTQFSQTPVSLDNTTNAILVAVIIYLLTYYVARYAWYRKLERENISKLYTIGIGGFIMLFLFTWILLFTIFSALA